MARMKYIIIYLSLIFSSSVSAQSTLESCSNDAVDFLSEISTPKVLNQDCYTLIENTKSYYNTDVSSDNLIQITGYQNILFTKVFTRDDNNNVILDANRVTAGHKTKLTNIIALDLLEDNSKIYVLNKNNFDYSVLSFKYNISGNITPSRILAGAELSQATNLVADFSSQKLFVISSSEAWIKVYNLKADQNGKNPENSLELQRQISGPQTQLIAPVDILINQSDLIVLDSDRILIFNKSDNGDNTPKKVIAGTNTNLINSKSISMDSNANIMVTNGDGNTLTFSKDASGNVAPLSP